MDSKETKPCFEKYSVGSYSVGEQIVVDSDSCGGDVESSDPWRILAGLVRTSRIDSAVIGCVLDTNFSIFHANNLDLDRC